MCPGVCVLRGICPGGKCPGGKCLGSKYPGVSVQGVHVWGGFYAVTGPHQVTNFENTIQKDNNGGCT